jgi:hypothetical protein
MTPHERTAILHRLERDRRSAACMQPFSAVVVQRETLIDLIEVAQGVLRQQE